MFPGPRNHNMMRVYCCDLTRYRWTEREVRGDPPILSESRRNLDCFLDGKRLIVFGKLLVRELEARMTSILKPCVMPCH